MSTFSERSNSISLAKIDPRPRSDYTMIGTTNSICPQCMDVVPTKIITRGKRVYFRKRCPEHGVREDFVCSDSSWWDRDEGHTPAVLPQVRSVAASRGCPYDCGLCEEHEQHTCIGLVELTDRCNLSCPMCFASSGPGGTDHSLEDIIASLDRLVQCEGHAEVVQLSGGEPTLHPQFRQVVDAALQRPIDFVMVNTNGVRLSKDDSLVEFLSQRRERVEIYLQWDGVDEQTNIRLRGEPLIEQKRAALRKLQEADIHVTLVATMAAPVHASFYSDLWQVALHHRNVVGLSLQPATFSGRHYLPEDLEDRVTFPDVIAGLVRGSSGNVQSSDFAPLPCAHPNCHQIMLAARDGENLMPLGQVGPVLENLDLIAGGISFTADRAKQLMQLFLERNSACSSDCGCNDLTSLSIGAKKELFEVDASRVAQEGSTTENSKVMQRFVSRVLQGEATAKDMMRVTITSFLDAYNFDTRQLMKCCTHHVLPSGHVIPFCAYNTLYRPGHLKLPELSGE